MTSELLHFFEDRQDVELALLIGSRVNGRARDTSDWDFAVQWRSDISLIDVLDKSETLRRDLANLLLVSPELVDLVDVYSARLAMRAVVAEEGVLIKGENTLAWSRFLLRTWGDLEDFYWGKCHAA